MVVNASGQEMEIGEVYEKQPSGMEVIPSGKTKETNEMQLLKAYEPIEVSDVGEFRSTDVNERQRENAYAPIETSVEGKSKVEIASHE